MNIQGRLRLSIETRMGKEGAVFECRYSLLAWVSVRLPRQGDHQIVAWIARRSRQ